mmetsp:Transcript_24323/g.63883  ORF Transcript_24323/g.63883 Transcript_24323/m.63883 type:complete len:203 (+) Transcript_24323:984-1592(+)
MRATPHAYRHPSSATARLCQEPHATRATFFSRRSPSCTCRGTGWYGPFSSTGNGDMSAKPQRPARAAPQAKSEPFKVTARLCQEPHDTSLTFPNPFSGILAGTGWKGPLRSVGSPWLGRPQRPASAFPHAHRSPVAEMAKLWPSLHATMTMRLFRTAPSVTFRGTGWYRTPSMGRPSREAKPQRPAHTLPQAKSSASATARL